MDKCLLMVGVVITEREQLHIITRFPMKLSSQAGIPVLLKNNVKKALDREWSEAVEVQVRQVLSLECWIEKHFGEEVGKPPVDRLPGVLRENMGRI